MPSLKYEEIIERLEIRGLRAAWSPDLGYAPVEREVAAIARDAAQALAGAAAIELAEPKLAFTNSSAIWLPLACAELRWQLELDGFWPVRASELCDLTRLAVRFGERADVKNWMEARRLRAQLEAEVAGFFAEFDILMTPTVACAAFAADGPIPNVIEGRDASVTGAEPFTMLANLSWIPAISVPGGLTREGLPVGLQIMARHHRDDIVLRLARVLEGACPWPRLSQ